MYELQFIYEASSGENNGDICAAEYKDQMESNMFLIFKSSE